MTKSRRFLKRVYSDAALEQLSARTYGYNGRMYTKYELSQMQRAAERKVRAAKRTYLAEDAAGLDTTQAASKLRTAWEQLKQFSRSANVPMDSSRVSTAGFGRSQASKAAWVNQRNTLTNAAGQTIIKVPHTDLYGQPNSITQKTNKNGGIDRNYYGPDGKQTKQISNNDHGEKTDVPYGEHGEHAHDYVYYEDGRLKARPKRNLNDAERKENSDIL